MQIWYIRQCADDDDDDDDDENYTNRSRRHAAKDRNWKQLNPYILDTLHVTIQKNNRPVWVIQKKGSLIQYNINL
jgi:hypothetical protein